MYIYIHESSWINLKFSQFLHFNGPLGGAKDRRSEGLPLQRGAGSGGNQSRRFPENMGRQLELRVSQSHAILAYTSYTISISI